MSIRVPSEILQSLLQCHWRSTCQSENHCTETNIWKTRAISRILNSKTININKKGFHHYHLFSITFYFLTYEEFSSPQDGLEERSLQLLLWQCSYFQCSNQLNASLILPFFWCKQNIVNTLHKKKRFISIELLTIID